MHAQKDLAASSGFRAGLITSLILLLTAELALAPFFATTSITTHSHTACRLVEIQSHKAQQEISSMELSLLSQT